MTIVLNNQKLLGFRISPGLVGGNQFASKIGDKTGGKPGVNIGSKSGGKPVVATGAKIGGKLGAKGA